MTARLTILALAAILAFGGLTTAFALSGDDDGTASADPIELRKDDAASDVLVEEDDDGPDGDGDSTRGNDGTRGGDNTYVGDRDGTWGDDGTGGGDNSYVAPAGGGGGGGGGGSFSGGGDT